MIYISSMFKLIKIIKEQSYSQKKDYKTKIIEDGTSVCVPGMVAFSFFGEVFFLTATCTLFFDEARLWLDMASNLRSLVKYVICQVYHANR